MICFLGIDGGGTRTRALLVDARGRALHQAESGPGNLHAVGPEAVAANLAAAIADCRKAVGVPPTATCLGLAGASSRQTRARLEAILREQALGTVELTTDAHIALEGAFDGGPGTLLIAGTGSVCLSRTESGDLRRAGGWGWLADDAGSGFCIGREAITRALRENDGRSPESGLRRLVFDTLQIAETADIIDRLHHPTLTPQEVAALAPGVCELAASGDPAALDICRSATAELAALVRAGCGESPGSARHLVLSGGLLKPASWFSQKLAEELAEFPIVEPARSPVEGAAERARRLALT